MYKKLLCLCLTLLFSQQFNAENATFELSQAEKTWIKENPTVLYGAEKDWAPFDFVDEQGEHQGLARDYLIEISKLTNLKFEPVIDDWNNLITGVRNKDIDLMPVIYSSPNRDDILRLTEPYDSVLEYFYIRDDLNIQDIQDLQGRTLVIPKAYATLNEITQQIPELKILEVNTLSDAIYAIIEKKADVVVDSQAVIEYLLKKNRLSGIKAFKPQSNTSKSIHMGVANDKLILYQIINRALSAIPLQTKNSISNKWFKDVNAPDLKSLGLSKQEQDWLNKHPVIRIGVESNWPPYEFVDDTGQLQGLSADILKLIEQRLEIKFNVLSEFNWSDTLNKVKTFEIDVISSIVKTDDRDQYLNFTQSYYSPPIAIFTRNDAQGISSLDDLKYKTIAIENEYYTHIELLKNYPEINFKTVETTADALKALSYGEVDAYVGDQGAANWIAEVETLNNLKLIPDVGFGDAPLRLGVRDDWTTFQTILNKALASISVAEMASIRRKWLGVSSKAIQQAEVIQLSESEKAWLNQNKVIRFTGDPNWLPFEAFDDQGNYIGIVAEHLQLIEQKLGIQVEIVPTQSWSESVNKVKSGEVDIISETVYSDLNSQLEFTQAYISSPVVIVMNSKQDYVEGINQLQDQKIALIKDYGYVSEIIKNYPNLNITTVESIQAGLTDVSTGKVDALFATLSQASYQISVLGINNVRIVGKTEFVNELAFGMQKEFAPLVPLFNRALDSIDQADKKLIFEKWGKEKFLTKIDYSLVFKLAAIFLALLLFIAYWNWRLSKEIKLRQELENQTQALIDSIPLQIMVTSRKGKLLSANPKALLDFKIEKNQLHKFNASYFYSDPKDSLEVGKELKLKGKVEEKIVSLNHSDGSIRSMMISIIPVIFNKKKAYLSIGLDMTERLYMEAELLSAKKNADNANQAKSQFLANMSHEIRTPMNAIIGFTELLNEQIVDTKLRSFVKTIQTAGRNLLTLINDILDLSKIEAGKLSIELKPCDPKSLINDVTNMFVLQARKNNLDLIVEIDEQLPPSLLLDSTRSRQVLFNLLGNAIKFTKEGYVKISAQAVNTNYENNKTDLFISIEDTGIGISKDQQEKIFEQFTQSEGQSVEQFGGTGLGLAIVKNLVEKMGGALRVKSDLGKGSTFIILLQGLTICSKEDENILEPLTQSASIRFLPATVLVVDDIEDNRNLVVANFSEQDLKILEANNGQEAVDLVAQHSVDLILMDIRMPVMNGYKAAEIIKQTSDVPIVALTASVMTDQFEKQKSKNFDGYLRKPILKSEIFKELASFLDFEVEDKLEPNPQSVQFSDKELSELPKTIEKLIEVSNQFKGIEKNTNIENIKEFSKAIESIAINSSLLILKDYQNILQHNIDIFDIAAIKHSLQSFVGLVEELKAVH